ncbi:uncharacterized protein EI90DRAFT_1967152 [Cantharellus anzutake]|uniref:uncharacterized protein n=1 Tax=Cantharellus anzutake TaxID=1750568 RepID=UPI00190877E2|nr:uncharacterized protein EI90DRAFT_1967152 [Cantharellus anzutake]KAF8326221.1 hypothetical protein EI90DRAFT_1967152 [Cantharellus anzutake]
MSQKRKLSSASEHHLAKRLTPGPYPQPPRTSTSSFQVRPDYLQTPQSLVNIPHDWHGGSAGSHPEVPGMAPTFGGSSDVFRNGIFPNELSAAPYPSCDHPQLHAPALECAYTTPDRIGESSESLANWSFQTTLTQPFPSPLELSLYDPFSLHGNSKGASGDVESSVPPFLEPTPSSPAGIPLQNHRTMLPGPSFSYPQASSLQVAQVSSWALQTRSTICHNQYGESVGPYRGSELVAPTPQSPSSSQNLPSQKCTGTRSWLDPRSGLNCVSQSSTSLLELPVPPIPTQIFLPNVELPQPSLPGTTEDPCITHTISAFDDNSAGAYTQLDGMGVPLPFLSEPMPPSSTAASSSDPQLCPSLSPLQPPQIHPTGLQTNQAYATMSHGGYDGMVVSSFGPGTAPPLESGSSSTFRYLKGLIPFHKRVTALPRISISDVQRHTALQVSGANPTSSQTPQTHGDVCHDWHAKSAESYLGPPRVAPKSHPSDSSRNLHSQQRMGAPPLWGPHSDPNYTNPSRTSLSERSISTAPTQSSPCNSELSLYPPSLSGTDRDPRATPTIWACQDNTARAQEQLQHAGIDLHMPPLSEPMLSSSAGPAVDGKNTTINTTKLILQIATPALKLSPIPLLSNIPDLLLILLQVYEVWRRFLRPIMRYHSHLLY